MSTLTVWKFPSADGALQAEQTLARLQRESVITIHDAAIVSWEQGKKKPKTRQLHNLAGAGALSGGFWGLLFGLIFFVPLFGLLVGATAGALTGSMADVGIDDRFIETMRKEVTPGTSALFVLTSDEVLDKVAQAFAGQQMQLVQTNLSHDQEARLREVFAEED